MTMTVVEFLHPLRENSLRDICISALYFAQRYEGTESATVDELRNVLKRGRIARAAKLNLADSLSKSAPYVTFSGREGHKLKWSLTPTGEKYVRTLVGLPDIDLEVEHDVGSLEELAASLPDRNIAEYVEESVTCLKVDALRASVVFLWAAAVRELQNRVIDTGIPALNKSILKYDPKMGRTIRKIDDLSYVKESTLLLVAQDLGVIDKSEKGILEECLNLRNKCGHPAKYNPGPKKASSFIEDITGILFK